MKDKELMFEEIEVSHTLGEFQTDVCLLQRIKRKLGEEEVEGVDVMKDEDLKIEEIEVSHTLGGVGSCHPHLNTFGNFCVYYNR